MALFDKINKEDLIAKAKKAVDKVSDVVKDSADSIKQYQNESRELKAPIEGAIARYGVTYNGGLPQHPKEKAGEIGLNIMPDRFALRSTIGTKEWFTDLDISYDVISSFRIVKRQAGTWEAVFSSADANVKDTETENVMEITYAAEDNEVVLRLEMLTGFNVYTQAKKCQELLDILRQHKILAKINKEMSASSIATVSPADELKKFKELLDLGVLTQEEFDAKKKQLLGL